MAIGSSQEPIVSRHKPSCRRLLGKRKVQRIERAESESGNLSRALGRRMARSNAKHRRFEPQLRRQAPVFARIPRILEIMSRRAHKLKPAGLCRVQDRRHCLRLSSNPLDRSVVKWTLEATQIEVDDLAHLVIVLP